MLRINVLSQMFLCFFVVCNLKNNDKIELMKIKKCCAGAKWRARWDQNHLIFFTWPKDINIERNLVSRGEKLATVFVFS